MPKGGRNIFSRHRWRNRPEVPRHPPSPSPFPPPPTSKRHDFEVLAPKFKYWPKIDWFWLWGWLINKGAIQITKGAICTRSAPLFWNFISLFQGPQTRLVRKISSQNQSIQISGAKMSRYAIFKYLSQNSKYKTFRFVRGKLPTSPIQGRLWSREAFAPAIVGMSGQIHVDFFRLLWFLADKQLRSYYGQGG